MQHFGSWKKINPLGTLLVFAKQHIHCIMECINLLKWDNPGLFLFIFWLFKQTIQFLQQINVKNEVAIQYTVPGFEPTTSQT